MNKALRSLALSLLAVLLNSGSAAAHDIPAEALVHALIRPSDHRLQLLVRVPLRTMRDIDFPEQQSGYLDIAKLAPQLPNASTQWISDFVQIYENGTRLRRPRVTATQISIESDRSFRSFEHALRHVNEPMLRNSANVSWEQALLDVLFEYPIESDRSEFAIRPGLEQLAARVLVVLRFVGPDGSVRAWEFSGDPGAVPLDPRWHQAAWRFIRLGFLHILDGTDHLLFLLCLVVPFRRFYSLLPVVTAFTLAHSITLIASAFNLAPDALWFPPLIEVLIAASIVYMALENIVGVKTWHRRCVIAFGFGLVHGFGFSFALRETLQFAGSHLLASLVSFNIGVELGQIFVLLLLIPALDLIFRFVVAERMGTIILSAFVAHTGWHWMTERADKLRQFRFEWMDLVPGLVAAILISLSVLLLRKRSAHSADLDEGLQVDGGASLSGVGERD